MSFSTIQVNNNLSQHCKKAYNSSKNQQDPSLNTAHNTHQYKPLAFWLDKTFKPIKLVSHLLKFFSANVVLILKCYRT